MTALILYGIVAGAIIFNVFIILWKLYHGRKLNGVIDATLLAGVLAVFSGSEALLIIGTLASVGISIGLIFIIPKTPTKPGIAITPESIAKWLDKHLS